MVTRRWTVVKQGDDTGGPSAAIQGAAGGGATEPPDSDEWRSFSQNVGRRDIPKKDLAVALFEKGLLTMERSAKLAGLTLDGFMDLLATTGTVAVDYPPDELEAEMKVKI